MLINFKIQFIIFRNLVHVKEQALVALNTARQWQAEQEYREQLFAKKHAKNVEHFRSLYEDRDVLIKKINEMHRDELILRNEINQIHETMQHNEPRSSGKDISSSLRYNNHVEKYASDSELDDVSIN